MLLGKLIVTHLVNKFLVFYEEIPLPSAELRIVYSLVIQHRFDPRLSSLCFDVGVQLSLNYYAL
jgi:hypothetical protein